MSWRERLRFWVGQRRPTTVHVQGVPILVPPGVLDPVLFRSGAWFATQVAQRVCEDTPVLDLGCGSGVVGALATRAGGQVVAVDIDPRAVAAARHNGLLDVRQGDLFDPVRGQRFSLVCFNPPYFPDRPERGAVDMALFGGPTLGVVTRFAAQVHDHLRPGGAALVCWSSLAPPAAPVLGPQWRCTLTAPVGDSAPETLELWERAAAPG